MDFFYITTYISINVSKVIEMTYRLDDDENVRPVSDRNRW